MAEPTDAAHGAAETSAGMPQLDFSTFPNQIFWLVVSLVALYFIINRVAIPQIRGAIEDRDQVVSSDLEAAAELRAQAAEAEDAYNKALAEARADAQRIAAETRAEIQKVLDAATAKADAEIAARTAESETRIDEIRESATQNVTEVAAEVGAAIVAAIMPDVADDGAVKAAVGAQMKG